MTSRVRTDGLKYEVVGSDGLGAYRLQIGPGAFVYAGIAEDMLELLSRKRAIATDRAAYKAEVDRVNRSTEREIAGNTFRRGDAVIAVPGLSYRGMIGRVVSFRDGRVIVDFGHAGEVDLPFSDVRPVGHVTSQTGPLAEVVAHVASPDPRLPLKRVTITTSDLRKLVFEDERATDLRDVAGALARARSALTVARQA